MKTVVITGSARGFGYQMLSLFYKNDFNVVLCDINEEALDIAYKDLISMNCKGDVLKCVVDITSSSDVSKMINEVLDKFSSIDIWINNAGVNQIMKPIWELDDKMINRLINIDLVGTIICSKLIVPVMAKQKSGAIYNVEGYGSDDATMLGLSIYGTAKRAVTYFTEALYKEIKESNLNIVVGKITPGIMITNFIDTSLGDGEKIELSEKTKNIYNILGDYPSTIADFMVKKILNNKKMNVKFVWLTPFRAMKRFFLAMFGVKNNYFD